MPVLAAETEMAQLSSGGFVEKRSRQLSREEFKNHGVIMLR